MACDALAPPTRRTVGSAWHEMRAFPPFTPTAPVRSAQSTSSGSIRHRDGCCFAALPGSRSVSLRRPPPGLPLGRIRPPRWRRSVRSPPTAASGLTPHRTVIQRAFAAVETVNLRIADLQKAGGMRDMNAEFKAARKAGTFVRYHDFLHAKKIAMMDTIARRR
jgi:hypothetical protein